MSADDYRKASLFATGSFDQDFPLPDLIGTTEILTEEHRFVLLKLTAYWTLSNSDKFQSISFIHFIIDELIIFVPNEKNREKLCGHLPARAEGYSWSLVFSTSQNGFSLNSLYRKLARIESPILIVIQDTDNNVSNMV